MGMLAAVEQAGTITSPLLEYIAAQFYSDEVPDALSQPLLAHLQSLPADRLRESIVPLGRMIFGRPDKLRCWKTSPPPASSSPARRINRARRRKASAWPIFSAVNNMC